VIQRNAIRLVDVYRRWDILPGSLEFLYELMKERDPEINISHSTLPTFTEHRQFVSRRPFRFWYLLEHWPEGAEKPLWVGYVSATHANEIGVVLLKAWRGRGFGPLAVKQLMHDHKPRVGEPSVRNPHWLANVAPANEHSKHMFTQLGFRKIQETYAYEEADHGSKEATPA
jgi:RimJ/RimL family protein N-acetyltransferase